MKRSLAGGICFLLAAIYAAAAAEPAPSAKTDARVSEDRIFAGVPVHILRPP
ncbi:MAG: hypothetical protein ACR2NX_05950 [Chthoniobacterales bacterium]